jgi:hypothetical protein
MTAILRDLPFREKDDEVAVGQERVRVKAYQIVVWVSLSPRHVADLPPHAPRFPAILDTGHSHNFSIQDRHLAQWAGLNLQALASLGRAREGGRYVPLHAANVWLHPNLPGARDVFSGRPPFLMRLDRGVAVYPSQHKYPRLPLLGLRALVRNRLHLAVDPERCVAHLRTPDWRTWLLRLLA